jgi:hypothetical protein
MHLSLERTHIENGQWTYIQTKTQITFKTTHNAHEYTLSKYTNYELKQIHKTCYYKQWTLNN